MKSLSLSVHKLRVVDIVVLSIFLSLLLVLSRFTFGIWEWRVSFGFIIIAIASAWYGPVWSSLIAGMADIIGTLLSGAVYFPGFTVSAVLGAMVYGYFFYGKEVTGKRIIISQLLIMVVVNTILNTYWLSLLFKTPFLAALPIRIIKELLNTPIQMGLLYLVLNSETLKRTQKRLFK